MIWVFIIIIIWVIYVIFEIRIKKHSRVLELPEFTLNIAGKIYSEKGEEYEHEVIVALYQNELKTVIGIQSEKHIKVERIVILAIEDVDKVGVYLDALRIGYLDKDSAREFCNPLPDLKFFLPVLWLLACCSVLVLKKTNHKKKMRSQRPHLLQGKLQPLLNAMLNSV